MKKLSQTSSPLVSTALLGFLAVAVAIGETKSTSTTTTTTTTTSTTTAAPAATGSTTLTTAAAPAPSPIAGFIELRPTITVGTGEAHTENTAQLGYKFSPSTSLNYRQEFNTNLFNPDEEMGLNPTLGDGMLIGRFDNLYNDTANGFSFSYEPRAYLPTADGMTSKGMVMAVRNYFKFKKTLSSTASLTVSEIPIFHLYNRAGTTKTEPNGTISGSANPAFENRLYVIADFSFLNKKLTLSIPVMWNAVRFQNYTYTDAAGALSGGDKSNRVVHKLWTYPELDYSLTDNTAIGVAYMTDNMLSYNKQGDFQLVDIASGFSKGTAQLVLRASL